MKNGIDVSAWQGVIDWERVKGDGIEFAMIRAGIGGNHIDKQFVRNISECNRLGIPCGVYWFCYALNAGEAAQEARYCLEAVKPYRLDYPIVYDLEYDTNNYAGKCGVTLTRAMMTDMIIAFCEEVEGAGYYAQYYTNYDYITYKLDAARLAPYDMWYAWYQESCNKACGLWQYTSTGSVDGISGNVDRNRAFKDYPSIMRAWGLNHLPQPEPEVRTPKVGDTVTVRLNAPVHYMYEAPVTVRAIRGENAVLAVGDQTVAVVALDDLLLK